MASDYSMIEQNVFEYFNAYTETMQTIIDFFDSSEDLVPNNYVMFPEDERIIRELCMRLNYIKHCYQKEIKGRFDKDELDKLVMRALEIWPTFLYKRDVI